MPRPYFLIACILSAIFFVNDSVAQSPGATKPPVAIIFDTDMGPDYDDVGALTLLHAFADSGECTLLATIASNRYPNVASVLNVLNTYFNRPETPIGVVSETGLNIICPQRWDSILVAGYPHRINNNHESEDALALYRKILAAQPDGSVTIVTVGFLTNMSNLLRSGPDGFSSLDGLSLVRKKVHRLVCMAGRFDGEFGKFREFNLMKDAVASKYVFDNWPGPILFSGFEIGAKIHTGLPLTRNTAIRNSPVKDVFAWSIPLDPGDSNGRMSWDETAVLVAVRGNRNYFDTTVGKIISYPDGSNGWDFSMQRDQFLVQKMPVSEIEKLLNDLIMHQPEKK